MYRFAVDAAYLGLRRCYSCTHQYTYTCRRTTGWAKRLPITQRHGVWDLMTALPHTSTVSLGERWLGTGRLKQQSGLLHSLLCNLLQQPRQRVVSVLSTTSASTAPMRPLATSLEKTALTVSVRPCCLTPFHVSMCPGCQHPTT